MILYNQNKEKPGFAGKICMEDQVLMTSLKCATGRRIKGATACATVNMTTSSSVSQREERIKVSALYHASLFPLL